MHKGRHPVKEEERQRRLQAGQGASPSTCGCQMGSPRRQEYAGCGKADDSRCRAGGPDRIRARHADITTTLSHADCSVRSRSTEDCGPVERQEGIVPGVWYQIRQGVRQRVNTNGPTNQCMSAVSDGGSTSTSESSSEEELETFEGMERPSEEAADRNKDVKHAYPAHGHLGRTRRSFDWQGKAEEAAKRSRPWTMTHAYEDLELRRIGDRLAREVAPGTEDPEPVEIMRKDVREEGARSQARVVHEADLRLGRLRPE